MDDMDEGVAHAKKLLVDGKTGAAIEECLELTNRGSMQAPDMLGIIYDSGLGVPRDLKKAEEYYVLSYNRRSASGTYHLAGLYQRQSRTSEALELFGKVATINPSAAYWAFRCLKELAVDNAKLNDDADDYLKLASRMGHLQASQTIAIRTIKGKAGIAKVPYGLFLLLKNVVFGMRSVWRGERLEYRDSLARIGQPGK